ncbi:MAG: PAS domain S-box protein [Pedobacter sp.]|nr:MAG: PAS domain S-box protein [Pedobacter sp.]
MSLPEEEYLSKIVSAIALTLNEDLTIRHVNQYGLKKLASVDSALVGKSVNQMGRKPISERSIEEIDAEHWEQIFNAIPMPVFVKDRQHRWVFFNDSLCNLQHKTRAELQNKNDYDFFPKAQADRFWQEEETLFLTGKEVFSEEFSLRNGTDSYVLIKKTRIKTSDGQEYLLGCCIDITKRKQAELALIESERRFRSLIRHSPDIIAIVGKDHLIRYITPSFYRLFELSENDIIGTSILAILHDQDKDNYFETINKAVGPKSEGTKIELRLKKSNGQYAILESFIKDLSFDPAINGIVMNCSDVTMVRAQSEEIERINKLLDADNNYLKSQLKNEIDARIDLKPLDFKEFKELYPDDASCIKYLAQLKWENGYRCKKCRQEKFGAGKIEYARRCSKCGYVETATSGTVFHRIKIPILEAFYMFFLLRSNPGITARELSICTSVKENTCWLFKKKINAQLNKNKGMQKNWEALMLIPIASKKQ